MGYISPVRVAKQRCPFAVMVCGVHVRKRVEHVAGLHAVEREQGEAGGGAGPRRVVEEKKERVAGGGTCG